MFEAHINAVIASIPPTLAVMIAAWKLSQGQRSLHINLNSRLSELIEANKKSFYAEGRAEGLASRET